MPETNGTTRPARKRTPAAAKSAAKPAPVKSTATAPAMVAGDDAEKTRITFALEMGEDTKTYRKFNPPADSGCVGTLYVPHGTEEVRVLLIGPAE